MPGKAEPMTTEVEQRSRRPQLLLLTVLVVAAVALLGYLRVTGDDGDAAARTSSTGALPGASPAATTEAPQSPVAVELTARLTTYLESLPPTKHAGHGGAAAAGKATTICGVRVYGYEPATAGTADDVTKVYGFHLCGVAQPGLDWDWAPKLVAPVIATYDISGTSPAKRTKPKVQMVEATPKVPYQERLRELFPPQYLPAASRGLESQATMDELRRRYDVAAAKPKA